MTQVPLAFSEAIPLSLYIHIPWCVRKCPYCDFNSHAVRDGIPEELYVDALLKDLEQELPLIWGRTVGTIFMGGGTPSLFSAASLDRLLSGVRALLPLAQNAEITLEANPGSAEAQRFRDYRSIGINRLSMGVQSFNDAALKALGRIHNADEAHRAIGMARDAGFDNFNLDLMFALPQQTVATALEDLKAAIAYEPTHLSYYQLTLEPNTAFYNAPPPLPAEDDAAEIEEVGHALLQASGYERYEVSAFTRDQRYANHNLNYWQFGDYVGIGAGAHGKLTLPAEGQIVRRTKQRQPDRYLRGIKEGFLSKQEAILQPEIPFEFMLNALRLTGGFDLELFSQRTGLAASVIEAQLEGLHADGLLVTKCGKTLPSALGFRYLNDVMERFLTEKSA